MRPGTGRTKAAGAARRQLNGVLLSPRAPNSPKEALFMNLMGPKVVILLLYLECSVGLKSYEMGSL